LLGPVRTAANTFSATAKPPHMISACSGEVDSGSPTRTCAKER
jgi:hypothetical protein